jgi:hypothetical protein
LSEEIDRKKRVLDEPADLPKDEMHKFAEASSNAPTRQYASQQNTPEHAIENPSEGPVVKSPEKPLDSGFESLLRQHLEQPVSDAAKRPPVIKRNEKGTQVLPHE